jgi:hypothetical protein
MFRSTPKALMLALAALVALMLPGRLGAHSDPWGEIHPQLAVQDGKFIMTFYRQEPDAVDGGRMDFRVIFNANGSVAVPRHVIDPARIPPHHYHPYSNDSSRWAEITGPKEAPARQIMVLKDMSKNPGTEIPLAVNCKGLVYAQRTTFAKSGIGIVVNSQHPDPGSGQCLLMLLHVDPQTYAEKGRVILGPCGMVYHFPTASEAVWAKNRWWIAWMGASEVTDKNIPPSEEWRTSVTLSSFDPATGKVHHKRLSNLASDCRPSLKTTGGWLGVCWHASQVIDGKRRARVVTAFEKLPES